MRRSAFTLVELLVVIAIIGLLIALLLPAVQAARESARRSQCNNNLKQLALSTLMFEDTYKYIPPGATGTWSAGWATFLLPFIEQIGGFEKLDLGAAAGFNPATYTPSNAALYNRDQFNGLMIPIFICPSSPCPAMVQPEDANPDVRILCGNYVGIMGATNSATDFTDPSGGGRNCDFSATAPAQLNKGGYASSNGVFYPCNPLAKNNCLLRLNRILDGTSNTLMLGEQSDYGVDPDVAPGVPGGGYKAMHDIRMPKRAGVWTGAATSITFAQPCPSANSMESASIITVRYPIGQKRRVSFSDGIARYGWNTPIQAVHPGGALVARVDGGTSFLRNSMSYDVLKFLCVRDDGRPVSVP